MTQPPRPPQPPRHPQTSKNFYDEIKNSLVAKLITIAIIIVILSVPLCMFSLLRDSRANRAREAENNVSSMWGGRQLVTAPVLSIPVFRFVQENNGRSRREDAAFYVLPEELNVSGELEPEIRARGIYQVMLYRSKIKMEGYFIWPEETKFQDNWQPAKEKETQFLVSVGDVKGIVELDFKQNGQSLKKNPGAGSQMVGCPINRQDLATGAKVPFTIELDLNGCRDLLFLPVGKSYGLKLASKWQHPSFIGGFLPIERTVSDNGFSATWKTNEINLPFAQSRISSSLSDYLPINRHYYLASELEDGFTLGVSLVQPTDTYHQVQRTWNYSFLIVAIVLVSFLIGEKVTKIHIHPLQYFFAGLSLVMFYVMLLALAEHIPFNLSYLITALLIAGMTTMYCRMIFERKQSAALLLGGIMLLAYILIFVLIRLEDYALLVGSCILLVLLAVLMKCTGHLNREELKKEEITQKKAN